eukprot:TRINITY_DN5331_c0_g1_i1.p1 TRINITY_DN5331_c0_g1~~TRINITY_DN5331_c0_g1_i1.p1  ORF type:complete len:485 (-),score=128.15 TRINITY_DN5331_c0_g1_i1:256-1710(-)
MRLFAPVALSAFSSVLLFVAYLYHDNVTTELRLRASRAEAALEAGLSDWRVLQPHTAWPLHLQKERFFQKMLDDYLVYHRNVTSGVLPPRFLMCSMSNGYGNAWQMFVSCILYAMLSDRAVIIVRRHYDTDNAFMNTFQELYERPPVKIMNEGPIEFLNTSFFGPPREIDWPWMDFSQVSYPVHVKDRKHDEQFLSVSGDEGFNYYADKLRESPRMGMLHKIPSNFYEMIFRQFVKLKPSYQSFVDEFKRKHFGAYTIGIQMRGNDPHGLHAVVPFYVYLQAAELLAADCPGPWDEVVFFVASQDYKAVQEAQAIYGTRKIAYFNASQERHTLEGDHAAALTIWLLGECNDVVSSESSSYGTNAAARRGIVPVVCNSDRSCMRRITPQPCSYLPYPVKPETCSDEAGSDNPCAGSFHRFSTVEGHCGAVFRKDHDCEYVGCRDQYNSFAPYRVMPRWPLCNLSRPGPPALPGHEYRDWLWQWRR